MYAAVWDANRGVHFGNPQPDLNASQTNDSNAKWLQQYRLATTQNGNLPQANVAGPNNFAANFAVAMQNYSMQNHAPAANFLQSGSTTPNAALAMLAAQASSQMKMEHAGYPGSMHYPYSSANMPGSFLNPAAVSTQMNAAGYSTSCAPVNGNTTLPTNSATVQNVAAVFDELFNRCKSTKVKGNHSGP